MKQLFIALGVILMTNTPTIAEPQLETLGHNICSSEFSAYAMQPAEYYVEGKRHVAKIIEDYANETLTAVELNQKIFSFIQEDILRSYLVFSNGYEEFPPHVAALLLATMLGADTDDTFWTALQEISARLDADTAVPFLSDDVHATYKAQLRQSFTVEAFSNQVIDLIQKTGARCEKTVTQYYLGDMLAKAFEPALGYSDPYGAQHFLDIESPDLRVQNEPFLKIAETLTEPEIIAIFPWVKKFSFEKYLSDGEDRFVLPQFAKEASPKFSQANELLQKELFAEFELREQQMYE